MDGLHPDHQKDLEASGLNAATVTAAKIHSVRPDRINKIMGWDAPVNSLLAFPYPGTDFTRYKLFPSLENKEGHAQKYTQPKGSPVRLYQPPGFNPQAKVIRLTEGEKKALKGCLEGLNVAALGGIWNFAVKDGSGNPVLIDDLAAIDWRNKTAELVPDGDWKAKEGVRHAVYRLGRMLRDRGASVRIVALPGNAKLDDYLVAPGPAKFHRLPRLKLNDQAFTDAHIKEGMRAGSTPELECPDIFTGAAGSFAELYSEILEVPKPFLFFGYLTCLGSYLADKITLAGELRLQPRLYTLLIGASADDRKSTGIKKAVDLFKEALPDFHVSAGMGSAEGLQSRLKDEPKLLLFFDEFAQFVGKCSIQGSVLLPCVTSLFENNFYDNQTKSERVELRDVYLSLIGASTRETFEKVWNSNFTNIGFDNRLFIVPGGTSDKCFAIPQELSYEHKRTLINDLLRIVQASSIPIAYEMKPDARELYAQWYKAMKEKRSFFSKRLDTYAARLMPLFAINDGFGRDYKIDCAMVEKTTRLCNWQMSVREAFSPIDADNRTARMEEKIRRVLKEGGGAMKERDLQKRVHAHREGLYIYNAGRKNLMENQEIYASKGSIILGPSS